MTGVIANASAILAGSFAGLFFKKGLPQNITDAVMKVLGAYVLCVGITGIFKSQNTLVMLVSLVAGTIIGEILDIDGAIKRLGNSLEKKAGVPQGGFAQGFIMGTILYCTGAMGIVGAIEAGTSGNTTTLLAKSVLDGVEAMLFTASIGMGIIASAGCVLFFEGGIVILAGILSPVLTSAMIAEISAVGSLMVMLLGLHIMEIAEIKVANLLPSIFAAPLIVWLFGSLGMS